VSSYFKIVNQKGAGEEKDEEGAGGCEPSSSPHCVCVIFHKRVMNSNYLLAIGAIAISMLGFCTHNS